MTITDLTQRQYLYTYTWKDKVGYIYAHSREAADKEFKKVFGFRPKPSVVAVTRSFG